MIVVESDWPSMAFFEPFIPVRCCLLCSEVACCGYGVALICV